jgi:hypothetical protein
MAQLNGPLDITGNLGNLSIFRDKRGRTIVRQKGGPSRKKVKTSTNYVLFRRSSSAMALASSSGKYLRVALRDIKAWCSDPTLYYRMNACLKSIISTDPAGDLKQRSISAGDPAPLETLEWNIDLPLEEALQADFSGHIEPSSGSMNLIVSSFTPSAHITAPPRATHFELVAVAVAWHPEQKKTVTSIKRTPPARISSKTMKAQTFQLHVKPESSTILLAGLGVIFSEFVGKKTVPLSGGSFTFLKAEKTAK